MGQTEIPRFARPYDWNEIDSAVREPGCIIAEGLFSEDETAALNRDIDAYLDAHPDAGRPGTGETSYDDFLGRRTIRLHGMVEKVARTASWIGQRELLGWAERYLEPIATSAVLSTAELIEPRPGAKKQRIHRDNESWSVLPPLAAPIQVGGLIALSRFTLENGGTYVVPESWSWDYARRAQPEQILRVTMEPGDAFLYRGDILHGAGANDTDKPRRFMGITYIPGWLRPIENNLLQVSKERARELEPHVRQLLGFGTYDGTRQSGGVLGTYNYGDPADWFED